MPQLDSVIWFSQVFWLFIVFFVFYFIIYLNYGPLLFKAQNFRCKKIESHYNSIVFYNYKNIEFLYKNWFSLSKLFNK
jgi:hypothetical protein